MDNLEKNKHFCPTRPKREALLTICNHCSLSRPLSSVKYNNPNPLISKTKTYNLDHKLSKYKIKKNKKVSHSAPLIGKFAYNP